MVRPPLRTARCVLACLLLVSLAGCAEEDETVASDESFTTAKEFDRELVLSDEALTDGEAFSVSEIQAFLENTPHGKRSVLADVSSNGRTAAEAYAEAGKKYSINPLVLLTRSQLEQGLVSATKASKHKLDWAMGCGCLDNKSCIEALRGFDRQIECAAERLRSYLTDMDEDGTSIAGWGVGKTRKTLDGYSVTPRNQATAAIYTYTPWASSAKNHASIWRKYAIASGYVAAAPGGCDVATFASGMRVQLRPSALSDLYDGERCFLDTWQLVNPSEHTVWDSAAKISDNFKVSEYASKSSDTEILLNPVLVEVVQSVRTKLAKSVSVKQAYQNPNAHASSCGSHCADTIELTQGLGVVVSSSVGNEAVLQAAAAVGAPTCFTTEAGVFIGVSQRELGCPR
jgi:hypothetical protein